MEYYYNLYRSENFICGRVLPQSLNIFSNEINNTIFDKLINENNKMILFHILNFSCTVNNLNLMKKIISKYNFFEENVTNFNTLINKALNYNSVDIVFFLYPYYKNKNIDKEIDLSHSNLNPKILNFLVFC